MLLGNGLALFRAWRVTPQRDGRRHPVSWVADGMVEPRAARKRNGRGSARGWVGHPLARRDFDVSGLAVAQNTPRRAKSIDFIDFDVSGLALESPGLKTSTGKLKASILTSAGLLWEAPGSKQAPER